MPSTPPTEAQEAALARLPTTLKGHYTIVYSSDDDMNFGKPWYVDRWWSRGSPSFKTRKGAENWASRHGCIHEHPQK